MSQPPVNFEMYLQDEWYLLNPATTFLLDDVDTAPAPSYLQDPGFGDMSYATDSLIDNTLPDWAPIGGQQDVAGLGLAAHNHFPPINVSGGIQAPSTATPPASAVNPPSAQDQTPKFTCKCGKHFSRIDSRKRHTKSKACTARTHRAANEFTCKYCDAYSTNRHDHLLQHLRVKHKFSKKALDKEKVRGKGVKDVEDVNANAEFEVEEGEM